MHPLAPSTRHLLAVAQVQAMTPPTRFLAGLPVLDMGQPLDEAGETLGLLDTGLWLVDARGGQDRRWQRDRLQGARN